MIVVASLACGLAASSAHAATVTAQVESCPRDGCSGAFTYQADAGETNRLRIVPVDGGYAFSDTGAVIRPGPGCVRAASDVECRFDSVSLVVQLGDGDDRVDASAVTSLTQMDGGPGADVLIGGAGAYDLLAGGAGQDALFGGPGSDYLRGDGVLQRSATPTPDAPASPDLIDGGKDGALVSYGGRRAAVRVDLAGGWGGQVGEGDRLVDITNAQGGSGNDALRGTNETNRLIGGSGDDKINGLAGDDFISGQSGTDLLRGGAGDDMFETELGSLDPGDDDRVLCGADDDTVTHTEPQTYVSPACESVGLNEGIRLGLPLRSPRSRGFALNEFFCPDVACARRVTVKPARPITGVRRGAVLGRASYRTGGNKHVRHLRGLRLTKLGRRLASRPSGVLVRVRLDTIDAIGERASDSSGFTTRLAIRRP